MDTVHTKVMRLDTTLAKPNINSTLWSELFLENKDPLISELDILIDNITKIKDAISAEDADALKALLEKGREVKQALGE